MSRARIGILGGSFDPPQLGHLILAEYSREILDLDCMLFVPVGDHPVKRSSARSPLPHRLAMLKLAIAGNQHFRISRVDIDRAGPHYSADTVNIIRAQQPDAQLYFVMGGDNLRDLPTWERPQELARSCRLAVMRRADEDIAPDMHDESLPGLSQQIDMIDVPLLSVWLSSTHVVSRLRAGHSVRYLVPDAVLDYICARNLYQ
ncbi:MAG: nicotinate-nucleotide adenylyltransferase [Chloroflexi bacterium]|nr:nicotinate-nucleotide adenylyltransferase [Chloroflexota bacterium]MCY4246948.1 nicotinate-nucleotide adenylyltransferase [Chloroflexota bacterium]